MRSFPFLWQLTRRRNRIAARTYTESFGRDPSEQRVAWVINQFERETQLDRERQVVFHLHRGMLDSSCGLARFSVSEDHLSVCRLFLQSLVTACMSLWDKQIPVGGNCSLCVCVWSSYIGEAAHVHQNELRWLHGDLTQLVERELPILSRHHDMIQSSYTDTDQWAWSLTLFTDTLSSSCAK